jgi:hypothetical protein
MTVSSRTPEGLPNHCPVCGNDLLIEPSRPAGDAPCPHCGHLLWFNRGPSPGWVVARRLALARNLSYAVQTVLWGWLFVWLWMGGGSERTVVVVVSLALLCGVLAAEAFVNELGHLLFHPAAARTLPRSSLFWQVVVRRTLAAVVCLVLITGPVWLVAAGFGLSMVTRRGPLECILLVGLAVLLFGRRIPEFGRWLGKSIAEFKYPFTGVLFLLTVGLAAAGSKEVAFVPPAPTVEVFGYAKVAVR